MLISCQPVIPQSEQAVTQESCSSGLSDFGIPFCALAVKAGLEKRRYLHFSSASAEKCLVSATFFTERERPAATVMHKKAYRYYTGESIL